MFFSFKAVIQLVCYLHGCVCKTWEFLEVLSTKPACGKVRVLIIQQHNLQSTITYRQAGQCLVYKELLRLATRPRPALL